jgi:hypothetical protein
MMSKNDLVRDIEKSIGNGARYIISEIVLNMIEDFIETEQERDQYKAELISSRNYWSELYSTTNKELQSLRAQIKEAQDGSPSEIEMHRMAFKMIQDHGFSCHEELLAAYRHLERSQVKLSKEVAEALDECERP